MVTELKVVSVERVSILGTEGEEPNDSIQEASISADGRRILFQTQATNLASGDENGALDVFVKDLVTGDLILVSQGVDSGLPASGGAFANAISTDGTLVTFQSDSNELLPFEITRQSDIFIRDIDAGITEIVSVDQNGDQVNGSSSSSVLSSDGGLVAFTSYASNLVPNDTNGVRDIFIKNLSSGEVTRISTSATGEQANARSEESVFSPDGTMVAFTSFADNLVSNDYNFNEDLFVKDLVSGEISMMTTDSAGNGHVGYGVASPKFSADGKYVLFLADYPSLTVGDYNSSYDVYRKDLSTGEIVRLSLSAEGEEWDEGVDGFDISPDGALLAFTSLSPEIVSVEQNPYRDIFVKDLATGSVILLSVNDKGEPADEMNEGPVFFPDGRHILYSSSASNLVEGDANTNIATKLYIAELGPATAEISLGRTEAETLDVEAGFVVMSNPHASDDAYLQASDAGEQIAFGEFTGESGLYTIVVGYFDETDGASTLSVEIDGELVDEWVWDSDPAGAIVTADAQMKRMVTKVHIDQGDIITIAGTADGGEPLRTDYLDIRESPPDGGSFRVEAETLEIVKNFVVSSNPHASEDQYLQAGNTGEQIALYDFDGAAGRYDLSIGYFDENDGVSRMSVLVNGEEVSNWLWDSEEGDRIVTKASAALHTISDLELAPGDEIELVGRPNGGEPLRTDFMEFAPIPPDVDEFLLV